MRMSIPVHPVLWPPSQNYELSSPRQDIISVRHRTSLMGLPALSVALLWGAGGLVATSRVFPHMWPGVSGSVLLIVLAMGWTVTAFTIADTITASVTGIIVYFTPKKARVHAVTDPGVVSGWNDRSISARVRQQTEGTNINGDDAPAVAWGRLMAALAVLLLLVVVLVSSYLHLAIGLFVALGMTFTALVAAHLRCGAPDLHRVSPHLLHLVQVRRA